MHGASVLDSLFVFTLQFIRIYFCIKYVLNNNSCVGSFDVTLLWYANLHLAYSIPLPLSQNHMGCQFSYWTYTYVCLWCTIQTGYAY